MKRPFWLSLSRRLLFSISLLLLVGVYWPVRADKVTPSNRVSNSVNVREEPSTASVAVGELRPGEQADLVLSIPRWHKVRLANGTEGFVSKSWTSG